MWNNGLLPNWERSTSRLYIVTLIYLKCRVQFSRSVVSNSATPWTAACQASLSTTNSSSLLKFMFNVLVVQSNNLIHCCAFLFPPSILPSIKVFSNESVLHIKVHHAKWWAAATKSLQLCPTLRLHRRQPTRLPRPWDSPGRNTRVGCHFLLYA